MIKTAPLAGQLREFPYLKWGFCRLSLVYFNSDEEIDYVVQALLHVANNAWKLLPQYDFEPQSSNWTHRNQRGVQPTVPPFRLDSGNVELHSDSVQVSISDPDSERQYYDDMLTNAMCVYNSSHSLYTADHEYAIDKVRDYESELIGQEQKQFSWFVFPKDILMSAKSQERAKWVCPFHQTDTHEDVSLHPERYWPTVIADMKRGSIAVENPSKERRASERRVPRTRPKFFDWSGLFCNRTGDDSCVHNPTNTTADAF